ncbi:hypothetical protein Dimus_020558, partial [Dionaea muscipula]
RIQYAKTKSDCVAKADGTYIPREKKKRQEEKAERKRHAEDTRQAAAANGSTHQNNGASAASYRKAGTGAKEAAAVPNNLLFVQNLPHETTASALQMLFQQYPGFREVRLIGAKPGIAFVEYEDEEQSSIAMEALQGFKITSSNPMEITYAKK